jgi:hypothetical protein
VIDGLKLIAAGAIVMVHVAMQPGANPLAAFFEQVSYSALHFFFLVAGYFHGSVGTRGRAWLRQRFVRLAVPYFTWSLVFVAWWNLYHVAKGWPLYFPNPIEFVFFAGAAEVLWSLPWLMVCALLAEGLATTPTARRALLVAAALIQLCVWVFVQPADLPHNAARQFVEGARWVFVYIAGMELRGLPGVPGSARLWITLAGGASVAAGLLAIPLGAQPTGTLPQIAMFCLNGTVALALLAGARAGVHWFGAASLAWGGHYLLGIYVSHGLWLAILIRFISAMSMPVGVWLVFGWAMCFGAALLVTRALLSHRVTKLMVT